MIPRYSRPEMAAIWSQETKFRIWFDIEVEALDAMAGLGTVPKEAARIVREKGGAATFDVERIDAIEREVKHDVIAFLTHLSEIVGPEARFVHQGLTSSDILDTCFNIQLVRAADILLADIDALLAALKKRAFEHRNTVTIGRSHGIHAEPTTFGVKLAQAYAEFARARRRLHDAREEVATCALSGAVGTFANVDPQIEEMVAHRLGLRPEPVSTQVIPRDRHAMYFATLGVVASSLERLAIEIRHLQRTEVLEAEEYFSPGQKGSSAMPHKRNPVLTENVTGLARLVRGMAIPAMENVALWHERDISHSSVERMIGPDATVTLDFAIVRMTSVIEKLIVYPENMQRNLDRLGGLVHSQRVLLALIDKGATREDAYTMVQRNAMRTWRGEGDFRHFLKNDPDVAALLSVGEIDALFDLGYHTRHVDTIFRRVFGIEADEAGVRSVQVTRTINASPKAAYRAWTDPAAMDWMGEKIVADVRVGGAYRIELNAGGTALVHAGVYKVLDPDRRILMTFRGGPKETMDAPVHASPYVNETLDIRLRPLADGTRTEVSLTDGWEGEPLAGEDAEALREAWEGWLGKLADRLEKGS